MSILSQEALGENAGLRQQIHRILFIAALSFLCIGMSVSKVFISIAELTLGLNWIAEGKLGAKWKRFITNKPALVLCSLYVMHLLGLIYTTNFKYGMDDIRVKVPLLILPFLFCTSEPLNTKERNIVLGLFMGGITVESLIGIYRLLHKGLIDIHEITPHVSTIRLALMIVLSIFLLLGYIFSRKWSMVSLVLAIWIAWFLIFLVIMESLTGIVITVGLASVLLVYYAYKRVKQHKVWYGIGLLSAIGILFIGIAVYLINFDHGYFPTIDKLNTDTLQKRSLNGSRYYTGDSYGGTESGHYIYTYLSYDELYPAWARRSKIPINGFDKKGNYIKFTLIRYLTSKNLTKDSAGVSKLDDTDIKAIENGMPNYNFKESGDVQYRLYQAFWEIEDYRNGDPNISGHSITQRLEFWRAALGIIQKHWLIGVGTGDVRIAFAKQYDEMHSNLKPEFRLRSHNQYLEIGVGFGCIGIAWFLLSLIYPGVKTKKIYSYTYFIFWIIFMLSMFSEDTLETQAGATFYAFFNSFFLFLV
ncbi:MAG TPA: O-antigen ligase family protein [Bacteroidia bacterium]|nr:O-antigen ligase family protein [Bacteroidia bacterium]